MFQVVLLATAAIVAVLSIGSLIVIGANQLKKFFKL